MLNEHVSGVGKRSIMIYYISDGGYKWTLMMKIGCMVLMKMYLYKVTLKYVNDLYLSYES